MFKEFREFIARGNVMDLAVGIIIGAAFTAIVNSLVNDIIMPPVSLALGGIDFTNRDFALTARMADIHVGPSRFYYSTDRGKTWNGPYRIPNFGQKGLFRFVRRTIRLSI